MVRARQAVGEEEHLHRFHRRGTTSRRNRRDPAGEPRRPRRQRWRAAGGGGRPHGGGVGGLLVGAVANMAPELFAGILAAVPFVDALTTILDPSLPLTVTEWDEWGNPLADKDVYYYMKSYSPYENVAAQHYPAILAMTSLNDTRVLYVEPAKWVAALRRTKTDDQPILLKTEMNAGHGGISGRYERWKEAAFQYAWLLDAAKANHDGSA